MLDHDSRPESVIDEVCENTAKTDLGHASPFFAAMHGPDLTRSLISDLGVRPMRRRNFITLLGLLATHSARSSGGADGNRAIQVIGPSIFGNASNDWLLRHTAHATGEAC